jgi:hypothetical protein
LAQGSGLLRIPREAGRRHSPARACGAWSCITWYFGVSPPSSPPPPPPLSSDTRTRPYRSTAPPSSPVCCAGFWPGTPARPLAKLARPAPPALSHPPVPAARFGLLCARVCALQVGRLVRRQLGADLLAVSVSCAPHTRRIPLCFACPAAAAGVKSSPAPLSHRLPISAGCAREGAVWRPRECAHSLKPPPHPHAPPHPPPPRLRR